MLVPDRVRKCVVFIGYQMADGTPRLAGSGFFVGRDDGTNAATSVFLVTARHVIEGIRRLGINDVFVRANTIAGTTTWAKCDGSDWRFHPTSPNVDVAVLRTGIPDGWDHLILPTSMCATDDLMSRHEVGLGDEVFITGLFRHHHGQAKNIPIVRVGNLAALSEEQVVTKEYGPIDAYLIEARSIGGLSGSPVFLNLGVSRFIGGGVKHSTTGPINLLLGLIHGHFDAQSFNVDATNQEADSSLSAEKINTGIAIVTPITKVLEAMSLVGPT
jgi:hypothetical protein